MIKYYFLLPNTEFQKSFDSDRDAFNHLKVLRKSNPSSDIKIWRKIKDYWHKGVGGGWVVDKDITFLFWLQEQIDTNLANRIDFKQDPQYFISKGAQNTAFKRVIDFYKTHML